MATTLPHPTASTASPAPNQLRSKDIMCAPLLHTHEQGPETLCGTALSWVVTKSKPHCTPMQRHMHLSSRATTLGTVTDAQDKCLVPRLQQPWNTQERTKIPPLPTKEQLPLPPGRPKVKLQAPVHVLCQQTRVKIATAKALSTSPGGCFDAGIAVD